MTIFLALQILYNGLLLAVCAFALHRGGRDEKIAAGLILACSVATGLVAALPGFQWRYDHWKVALIDAFLFVGFGWLASVTKRFWPLWATAFQAIDITLHALGLLIPERMIQAYAWLQGFWAYPILILIAIGTSRSKKATPSDPQILRDS